MRHNDYLYFLVTIIITCHCSFYIIVVVVHLLLSCYFYILSIHILYIYIYSSLILKKKLYFRISTIFI